MYEEYLAIEQGELDKLDWKEELGKDPDIFLECCIQELDVVKTFSRESPKFFLLQSKSKDLDFPEVWFIGKKAFDGINSVLEGGVQNNRQVEKLCYLLVNYWTWEVKIEYSKGNRIFTDRQGNLLSREEVDDMGRTAVAVNFMVYAWDHADELGRGMIELGMNAFILQAIDSLVISWVMRGWGVRDYCWVSSLSQKLKEWELVRSKAADNASRAAKARHAETEWIKREVFNYFDEHRHEFKSLRAAAKEIEKREPVKFRTIYDWLRNRE